MNEIVAKFSDALSMFWQSLDDQERRLLALAVAWLGAALVMAPIERGRRRHERAELADEVARLLTERAAERGSRG